MQLRIRIFGQCLRDSEGGLEATVPQICSTQLCGCSCGFGILDLVRRQASLARGAQAVSDESLPRSQHEYERATKSRTAGLPGIHNKNM